MNLGVVLQRKSGEMGIRHQFACFVHSLKALRQVGEMVGTGVELNEMRLLEPILDKSNYLTAWHRRRHYRRSGRKSDKSDRYGKWDAYGL